MKLTQALPRMLALLAGLFMLTGALAAEPMRQRRVPMPWMRNTS